MLTFILLSVVMLSVILLSGIKLSHILLSVILEWSEVSFIECRYAERHCSADCHFTECL